ncbi:beta-glucosidase-like [Olea europaea subsp. europaea]|uniref:Beta-glucosidase-like n=1 Tax=Olea europaea subsp. europaea TaxID=158383 RepID=A0A8S0UAB3_OLEEU|nr:beta-glucosidase-like [Olea europaea subsp. europaea]
MDTNKKHFCEFAEVCFWEFGDRVKRWITLNEPWAFSYCGYVRGNFSPRRGKPPPNKAEPATGVQDGANLMDHVMNLLGATSMEELAASIEQLLRNLILHHRSAIPPLTPPSDRDPITELLAMLFNLPT